MVAFLRVPAWFWLLMLGLYFLASIGIGVLFRVPDFTENAGAILTIIGAAMVILQFLIEEVVERARTTRSDKWAPTGSTTFNRILARHHESLRLRTRSDRFGVILVLAALVVLAEVLSTWGGALVREWL